MATLNVLVLAAEQLSEREDQVQQQLLDRLSSHREIEALSVVLPRAEAMLAPRLIGLWNHLVLVGTTASPDLPAEVIIEQEREVLSVLPSVSVVGTPSQVWARWTGFHDALRRLHPDGCGFAPEDVDVVDRVVAAIELPLRQGGTPL